MPRGLVRLHLAISADEGPEVIYEVAAVTIKMSATIIMPIRINFIGFVLFVSIVFVFCNLLIEQVPL